MPIKLTADEFEKRLRAVASAKDAEHLMRYFKTEEGGYGYGDTFIGVRMGAVFALAKEFQEMEINEIEKLLDSPIHEARAGAVSIMDYVARKKKTDEETRKGLFDLYLRRHDRINNWDLVDRSAIWVVGRYLFDKPRDVLYKLAVSKNLWERRTSIIATAYFIKQGEAEDTLKIAEILLTDKQDLIHKATGWMLRVVGGKELLSFLDKHAKTMPRTMLRYSIEKLDKKQREYYMGLKKG